MLAKHSVPHRNICVSPWPKTPRINNNNNFSYQTIWRSSHFPGHSNRISCSKRTRTVIKPNSAAQHSCHYSCSLLIFSGLNKIPKNPYLLWEICCCMKCPVCLEAQKYLGTLSFWLTNTSDLLWFSRNQHWPSVAGPDRNDAAHTCPAGTVSTCLSAYKEEQHSNECGFMRIGS